MSWKAVRVGILLLVLGMVALDAALTRWRTTDWDAPLRVSLYPIAGDGSQRTRDYVDKLRPEDFADIAAFFAREARAHGVTLAEPVRITLGRRIDERPPPPPGPGNLLGAVTWSLKLRWWSHQQEADLPRPHSQSRVYVQYYDPEQIQVVSHSLGLQKGLIGVVHAFASRAQGPTNNFVIAHELLHTLGATDKYDPATSLPVYPDGYAEPEREPRYPQRAAELMGGRIPVSADRAEIPVSLQQATIGALTAREIGWSKGR